MHRVLFQGLIWEKSVHYMAGNTVTLTWRVKHGLSVAQHQLWTAADQKVWRAALATSSRDPAGMGPISTRILSSLAHSSGR